MKKETKQTLGVFGIIASLIVGLGFFLIDQAFFGGLTIFVMLTGLFLIDFNE